MFRASLAAGLVLAPVLLAGAQDRETKVRNDRQQVGADDSWIYNDLDTAIETARKTGKPILAIIRCIP